MLPIHLLSTGKALPEQRVTSAELDTRLGHSAGYVRKKSGIDVRHHATLAEHQSALAGTAVRDALRRANVPAASIDLLISASGVQEQALPNTATRILEPAGLPAGTPVNVMLRPSGDTVPILMRPVTTPVQLSSSVFFGQMQAPRA